MMPKLSTTIRLLAFRQLLEGVNALHTAQPLPFIHRDLKPSNIGIVEIEELNFQVVILDYGQMIAASSGNGKAGTPGYQAPEMQDRTYGSTVDIWACGIIGLELLVPEGSLWSKAKSQYEVEERSTFLSQHDPAMPQHLIGQMLAWEPDERIHAIKALYHPCFSSLLAHVSDPASKPEPPGPKRHR
jgi:serine/threonine protein kinase